MDHIAYFKLQSKNLFKDYKTQFITDDDGYAYCEYSPKYFDIDRILLEYDGVLHECCWDEKNLSLMQIQHLFAQMIGFKKWASILNASDAELELARLLFDNQDRISLEDWEMYIDGVERENGVIFDTKTKVEIFTQTFLRIEGHHNPFGDYRLNKN